MTFALNSALSFVLFLLMTSIVFTYCRLCLSHFWVHYKTLIKVLNTCKDKEKARQLEFELDQDYMELGQELRAIGKTELGENESYENALAAYETKNQFLQELKARIADKDKRCFDALQFADRLEDITNIKFSEVLWCSLIDHVSVPTGGKKSLIFHLRNGGAIDIVLDQ